MEKYRKRRVFPFIKQAGGMDCGTTALAMILRYYGYANIRGFLADYCQVTTEGIDLYTLSVVAEKFGLEADGYQMRPQDFGKITLPCIAHYQGNHFVVVYKTSEKYVYLADPAVGKYRLTWERFNKRWNGIVLALSPTEELFADNELTQKAQARKKAEREVYRKHFWPSVRKHKKLLYYVVGGTLLLQGLALALPLFSQALVDLVLVNQSYKLLYAVLLGISLIFLCQVFFSYLRNLLVAQVKINIERDFFSRFFDHFLHLPQSFYDRHKREDFIHRFQENLKLRQVFSSSVLESFIDLLFVATYALVLLMYHVQFGLLALCFLAVYVAVVIWLSPKMRKLENLVFLENARTMGAFLDTLLGIRSVRLLGIERLKFWQWKNRYTKALNVALDAERVYVLFNTALTGVGYLGQALMYWMGAVYMMRGQLSMGQYIAFITIFHLIITALSRARALWILVAETSVSLEKISDILIQPRIDTEVARKSPVPPRPALQVQALSFKYQQRAEKNTLEEINCLAEPGKFYGLVGRNGSGKSTLVNLLAGFYEPTGGTVSLGGVPLRRVARTELRKRVVMVPQEVYLFNGTIKENIRYANPQATDAQIIEAAKLADIHDFLKDQYLGYNLMIGDQGVNLSGGQKLKVAFARLFLTQPDVILLDEASSALDVETERTIMQHVRERFAESTLISVAHRLHTLREADSIWVMDQGKLVQQGTHSQLSYEEGVYQNFMNTYVNYG